MPSLSQEVINLLKNTKITELAYLTNLVSMSRDITDKTQKHSELQNKPVKSQGIAYVL